MDILLAAGEIKGERTKLSSLFLIILMSICHVIDDFVFQPICLSKLIQKKFWLETNIKTKLVREISKFGNFSINTVKEALDTKQISKWQYDKETWKVIDRMIKHPEKSIIWFTLNEK